jgi:MOSC domain-containing protein YiiM
MLEDKVCIGDRYRVGTVELIVTQPRMPCYKLAIRFGRVDIVKRFLRSGRSGFYFAVEREGRSAPEMSSSKIAHDEGGLTIADVVTLYSTDATNQALLKRASAHPALPASWRDYFRKRLSEPSA